MTKIIGIDLGTSTACVSIMEGGAPKVIENSEGKRTTPAIVAFTKSGERLVGQSAEWRMMADPARTLFCVRRLVGRKFSDPEVRRFAETSPFEIVPGPDGDAAIKVAAIKVADRICSPVVPLAMMLGKMKRIAEEYLGETVTEAVVTVPAHFNFAQIQAVRDAGKIAGLNVQRTVQDSVAASLAYGLDKQEEEKIAVFDLGGGAFDISILEIGDGVFEVKSTNGDTFLGGEEFDRRIVNWLADEFKRENGIDLRGDTMALQRLKNEAEKAKKALSTAQETDINLPFITVNGAVPKNLNVKLSRTRLEALTADLIHRCERRCRRALRDAGLPRDAIDEVILVGGMTRMPKIRETVKAIFGKEPRRNVNPDEVVAMGAAIQGGVLKGDVKDVLLLNVTPLSLGIETMDEALPLGTGFPGGVMTRIIEKNTCIPTKRAEVFSTAADNQTAVSVHVLQGEHEMAADNRSIGRFDLTDIPPAPRGVPQIEVTFDLDANGILSVSAKDLGTGKEQSIRITASSGLSEAEIERMKKDVWEADPSQNEPHEPRTGVNGQGRQMEGMVENILLDLLPTVDNLDRALSQADQESASVDAESRLKGMFEGVRLIRKGLLGTLERFGVTPLESLGRPFNPEEQEAISMAADTMIPANHIVREFVRGYRFNGRMLRHAQVVVSSGPPK